MDELKLWMPSVLGFTKNIYRELLHVLEQRPMTSKVVRVTYIQPML